MKEKEPLVFIIFGATGDLANKKIIPALLDLYQKDLLPDFFRVVGFSRKDLSNDDYRKFAENSISASGINVGSEKLQNFLQFFQYKQGDIKDLETYENLNEYLSDLDKANGICSNRIFYLALPPNLYNDSFSNLAESGLAENCGESGGNWTRVLVEKPFGNNEKGAQILDKKLGSLFKESQIFRIDHYLAKEAIQNILTFRFANAIFEPLWSNEYIEKIEIILHEKNDVSNRTNFYDQIGALKDVGQNHILQMLAAVIMNDPRGTTPEKIRESRYDALSRVELFSRNISESAYRAQYDEYLKNPAIDPKSTTETFFRLKLSLNDRRWKNVPIYIESGKGLSENLAEITITFKEKESFVCQIGEICAYNNVLKINIQPTEKISLLFWAKKSGLTFELEQKELSFTYGAEKKDLRDAYEKVLYDCIKGDLTLFPSTKEVATQWRIISQILSKWNSLPLEIYKKGVSASEIKKSFD